MDSWPREKDYRVSSTPTSLTVVGGNKVRYQHGTSMFNLGPEEMGEFHKFFFVLVWMMLRLDLVLLIWMRFVMNLKSMLRIMREIFCS